MAFDYCTATEAFQYGNSAGNATDPVDEASVMASLVTAIARAIDGYCEQAFSLETYVNQRLRGTVDADGILVVNPPTPVIVSLASAAYRVGNSPTWFPLNLASADVEDRTIGATVRFLEDFSADRWRPIAVRLSYDGGYASRQALPNDLRWAAQALSWLTYQRRSAPMDTTAMPELGVVIRPGTWPDDIRQLLNRYKKVTPP